MQRGGADAKSRARSAEDGSEHELGDLAWATTTRRRTGSPPGGPAAESLGGEGLLKALGRDES